MYIQQPLTIGREATSITDDICKCFIKLSPEGLCAVVIVSVRGTEDTGSNPCTYVVCTSYVGKK
jgi:hypothetical protein